MTRSQNLPPRHRGHYLLVGLYVVTLLGLIGMTALYAYARLAAKHFAPEERYATASMLGAMLFFIVALYYSEGLEVAALVLRDLDPHSLSLGHDPLVLLRRVRRRTAWFLSGRQLIVVALVVIFADLCAAYARDAQASGASPGFSVFFTQWAKGLYAGAFPVLTALWFSQLYSKFMAERRPASFFGSTLAQIAANVSLFLGRTMAVGDISYALAKYRIGTRKDEARTPSREKTYEALATFREGIGFEKLAFDIAINPCDGSSSIVVDAYVRAYSPGGKLFKQEDYWDAGVLEVPEPMLTTSRPATHTGPEISKDRKNISWTFHLQEPLEPGDEFRFVTSYALGPGAMSFQPQKPDSFTHEGTKYPVKDLVVAVRFDPQAGTRTEGRSGVVPTVGNAKVAVSISDDPDIDEREGQRVTRCIRRQENGCRFEIPYPLLGGTYHCQWVVGLAVRSTIEPGARS